MLIKSVGLLVFEGSRGIFKTKAILPTSKSIGGGV